MHKTYIYMYQGFWNLENLHTCILDIGEEIEIFFYYINSNIFGCTRTQSYFHTSNFYFYLTSTDGDIHAKQLADGNLRRYM